MTIKNHHRSYHFQFLCLIAIWASAGAGQTVVASQAEADWAIVETRVRFSQTLDSDPGDNFEFWGNVNVKFDDYVMARTNVADQNKHLICSRGQIGAGKNWVAAVITAAATIGAGVATGGFSTALVVATAGTGLITALVGQTNTGAYDCSGGYIATVRYPVSVGVDTFHYSFEVHLREDDLFGDDDWVMDTRHDPGHKNNWSPLDECWGQSFNPDAISPAAFEQVRLCRLFDRICTTEDCDEHQFFTHPLLGNVQATRGYLVFESVILAWIKGPVVDGEVQDFDSNGRTSVTRRSFYGPSFGIHDV